MDTEALRAFLAKPYDAIVATNRPGKGAQLTPIWFLWDGERFLFTTQRSTVKHANIVRDPNISLIVNDPTRPFCVTAYGRAELAEAEQYPDFWNELLTKYLPADRHEQFNARMRSNPRFDPIVVVLKPAKLTERAIPA